MEVVERCKQALVQQLHANAALVLHAILRFRSAVGDGLRRIGGRVLLMAEIQRNIFERFDHDTVRNQPAVDRRLVTFVGDLVVQG